MIESQVIELARKISLKAEDFTPDYIVGIVGPGLIPATMLAEYMETPLHTLDVKDGEMNCWMAEHAYGYIPEEEREEASLTTLVEYSKRILIVDDICRTGETFKWIKQDWEGACLPGDREVWDEVWHDKVRFAALWYNFGCDFDIDYYAETPQISWDHTKFLQNWWKNA